MPYLIQRPMPPLPNTDKEIAKLAVDQRTDYHDEKTPGLLLRVGPKREGRKVVKAWSLLYYIHGNRQRVTLGRYPTVGLSDARDQAREELRTLQRKGIAPRQARHAAKLAAAQEKAESVEALASLYIEKHARKRKRSWKEDQRMLDRYVLPAWRTRPARSITRSEVRELLEGIAEQKPIQANRVLEVVRKMFYFAMDRELLSVNPAARMPKPSEERKRERVLTDDEIRKFWRVTEGLDLPMRAFWQLRLVTAQRGAEVLGMRWSDLDLPGRAWTIPAHQAGRKGHGQQRRAHAVPLTQPAIEMIKAVRSAVDTYLKENPHAKEPAFVCRGALGKRQRAVAASAFGLPDFVGHDLRRTATTLMRKAGVSRTDVSAVLGHAIREGSAALAHYDLWAMWPEKKRALTKWARVLMDVIENRPKQKVVAIR